MTEFDFHMKEYDHKRCNLLFKDGMWDTGVIALVIQNAHCTYQFIKPNNIIEFYKYFNKSDYENMQRFCKEIDLESLDDVIMLQ